MSGEDPTKRSATMRAVKSRDTTPELIVRALLRRFAPSYRLHRKDLPGNPDIAYIGKRRAIFVHGCFWHGHDCPRGARAPKANAEYWRAKIARNRARDKANAEKLSRAGLERADGLGVRTQGFGRAGATAAGFFGVRRRRWAGVQFHWSGTIPTEQARRQPCSPLARRWPPTGACSFPRLEWSAHPRCR